MAEKVSQQNTKLIRAQARNLHISPRKVRLVTSLVQGMSASDALTQLMFTHKKASKMVAKAISSAIANAENNFSVAPEQLFVKSITADMGRTTTRFMPRARGSASPIKHRSSHISVVLEVRAVAALKKSRFQLLRRKKAETKTEETAATEPVTQETALPQTAGSKPPVPVKTGEQRKENRVQQKRRLFNRKSGE